MRVPKGGQSDPLDRKETFLSREQILHSSCVRNTVCMIQGLTGRKFGSTCKLSSCPIRDKWQPDDEEGSELGKGSVHALICFVSRLIFVLSESRTYTCERLVHNHYLLSPSLSRSLPSPFLFSLFLHPFFFFSLSSSISPPATFTSITVTNHHHAHSTSSSIPFSRFLPIKFCDFFMVITEFLVQNSSYFHFRREEERKRGTSSWELVLTLPWLLCSHLVKKRN